jgi:membrane protease YdiL (CAAX protease family)
VTETGQASALKREWRRWTEGLSLPTVLVLLISTVLLILFHDNCSSHVFRAKFLRYFSTSEFKPLYPAFFWYGCSFLVLGVIPLLIGRFGLRRPVREWGVGLGDWKFGLPAVLICYFAFLPVLVVVSYQPAFMAKYPLFDQAQKSVTLFIIYELSYMLYFIGWEFIFRGFMLFGLKPALGLYAVFVQTIPFAIMHFGKPQIETLAAVFAGVLLGYLAVRTRSFWYGWMLHSLVAVTNDILATIQE